MGIKKINVLIVDGDEITLFAYQKILEKYFERIHKAQNGQEAKDIVFLLENDKQHIDLALVHEWTQDLTGKEICQLIRDRNPEARIIAVTANPIYYKPENAKEDGFDDYLLKPNNVEDFKKIVFKEKFKDYLLETK
ncbi:MAG: response regulator [Candidatus Falkowbacteria bacterium]